MTAEHGTRAGERARKRVLSAALAAIEERGPDRVRVQDIASRAGMSSGHVLYYFGDRDRILVDTLLMSEAQLAERRDRSLARASGTDDAVERLCRLYLPSGPRDVRWTLWAQALARPAADPAARSALRAAVDQWTERLSAAISVGKATGASPTLDAQATAYRLCRFMDGLAMEVLLAAPGRSRAWAVAEALDTWHFLSSR